MQNQIIVCDRWQVRSKRFQTSKKMNVEKFKEKTSASSEAQQARQARKQSDVVSQLKLLITSSHNCRKFSGKCP